MSRASPKIKCTGQDLLTNDVNNAQFACLLKQMMSYNFYFNSRHVSSHCQ